MNLKSLVSYHRFTAKAVSLLALIFFTTTPLMAVSYSLQGQSKGSTNWVAGNLMNWQELDYIPCRVYIFSGPAANQTITLTFPHFMGTTPGFQDLFSFTNSPNVVFTSTPVLSAPASGGWSYTFTVSITDANVGYVQFLARLAAGAHLNAGSSLKISGDPSSMGALQIHKPATGPGLPDLALVKAGPATAQPGQTITYTLTYTNKPFTTNAVGVQVSDAFSPGLIIDTNSLNGGVMSGNTIFWDLPNLSPSTGGVITFQAQVDPLATAGQTITNFAQILSSQNDIDSSDNSSRVITTVVILCTPPSIQTQPVGAVKCPGQSASFNVAATGTLPLSYQWFKNGSPLLNATNTTLNLAAVSASDAGAYFARVSNGCGANDSSIANLVVNTNVSASALTSLTKCPGDSASFSTVASGTGPFSYVWKKDGTTLSETSATLSIASVTSANAGSYSVEVSGACGTATQSATLTVSTNVSASALTSLTKCPSESASFSTTASGTGPFSYVWKKDGTTLSETSSTLTIASVSAANAGSYSVEVSGACGTTTQSATLTVNTNVSASALTSLTKCPGDSASFSTVASGTGPFSYVWKKDGTTLSETGAILTIASVSSANAGGYSVEVSGACGTATQSATLTMNTNVSASALTSLTKCTGDSASFSTTASGTGPFSYVWKKDGTTLSETSATLTIASVSSANAGGYSVEVSGACGTATQSATLTVNTNVSASALTSLTKCPGESASFSTVASGTGPFSYVWKKDGTTLSESSGTLTIASVSSANAGSYSVEVSGACGTTTQSATLTVNTNVSATPLTSLTKCPGESASFSTVVSGTGPFKIRWRHDGGPILSETSTLNIPLVNAASAGTYSVEVIGACGTVTQSATLTVNTSVSATPLTSLTKCPGESASFSTVASGTGPFSYVWKKDGTILSETSATLAITSVSSANAGSYSVEVSGACGTATQSATLTVNTNVSTSALTSLTKCPGQSASFSTVASGTGPFSYVWKKDGTTLSETSATLTIASVTSANAGSYSVEVSGACGTATQSATLTVNTNVSASALTSLTKCPSESASFSTTASGTGPFSYVWKKDGTTLSETSATLTIASVSSANAGSYSVEVSGACGTSTQSATLTVNANVSASALTSLTKCPGESASFSTTASGTGPFSYVWKKDGTTLSETSATLTIASVSSANAGSYSVEVSGACGTSTQSATLTVNNSVTTSPLTSVLTNPGATVVFSTVASGSGPFTYVWQKNGVTIGAQTGSSLVISNVNVSNEGTYTVTVTGSCGSVSSSATLTVNRAPTVEIVTPTDGSVLAALQDISILAHAADSDGTVTNVELFVSTNLIAQFIGEPYQTTITNPAVGTYVISARATDNMGLSSTSAPVTVTVTEELPITVISAMHLNRQTGLYEQTIRVFNPTPYTIPGIGVLVYDLQTNVQVYNVTRVINGVPVVVNRLPVISNSYADIIIKYYVTDGVTIPNPTLVGVAMPAAGSVGVSGTPVQIKRAQYLPDGSYLLNFGTVTNAVYFVQYSDDLVTWNTSSETVRGTGYNVQWIDYGPPSTDSYPSSTKTRYYRVVSIP